MATTMGTNKVYILDKYFNELQKFWDTEKRLQGKLHTAQIMQCSTSSWPMLNQTLTVFLEPLLLALRE